MAIIGSISIEGEPPVYVLPSESGRAKIDEPGRARNDTDRPAGDAAAYELWRTSLHQCTLTLCASQNVKDAPVRRWVPHAVQGLRAPSRRSARSQAEQSNNSIISARSRPKLSAGRGGFDTARHALSQRGEGFPEHPRLAGSLETILTIRASRRLATCRVHRNSGDAWIHAGPIGRIRARAQRARRRRAVAQGAGS